MFGERRLGHRTVHRPQRRQCRSVVVLRRHRRRRRGSGRYSALITRSESHSLTQISHEHAPILLGSHNCGESVTSIAATHCGTLILCCTFTGIVFGLTRADSIPQTLNPNFIVIEKDAAMRLDLLKQECEQLELRLIEERQRYQDMTTGMAAVSSKKTQKSPGLSALPYFAINDSFVLQEGIVGEK